MQRRQGEATCQLPHPCCEACCPRRRNRAPALAHLLWLIGWRRLVVTGLCLVAWRALNEVTVPGLSPAFISARLQVADTSTLVHAIGAGSLFSAYSIVAMGVGPYVNALIVMSLLTAISPRVRAIGNGADGLLRLRLWTRAL